MSAAVVAAVAPPKLQVLGLTRRYANGVLANDGVSLQVVPGSIHAVVGENGAGKSTLMKVLYGLEQPDAGTVELDGRPVLLRRPSEAITLGIGLVPQHLEQIESMSVAENIVLGAEPVRGPWLDRAQARREVLALVGRHGLDVDPDAKLAELSVGERQRVEILKTLRRGASLLLLDEPSALLSPIEVDRLFDSLRALVRAGLTVVLITHKMAEVLAACDDFTVMRAGRVVGSGRVCDHDTRQIAAMIVGGGGAGVVAGVVDPQPVPRVDARGSLPRVRVRGLSLARAQGRPELDRIAFDVAPGEILGIAGVEGNGQSRLVELLSGLTPPTAGTAEIDGASFVGAGVRAARRLGVGCVPEDRLHGGLAPGLSVAENGAALDYFAPPLSRRGVIDTAALRQRGRALIERFGIRARDEQVPLGSLSGGNMQKLLLGRELLAEPRFLIVSQPTRGVDPGAAQALRRSIVGLRDAGAAVLLLSADLDELFELADRIAVLFEGRLVAHWRAGDATPEGVGRSMTGLDARTPIDAVLDRTIRRVA